MAKKERKRFSAIAKCNSKNYDSLFRFVFAVAVAIRPIHFQFIIDMGKKQPISFEQKIKRLLQGNPRGLLRFCGEIKKAGRLRPGILGVYCFRVDDNGFIAAHFPRDTQRIAIAENMPILFPVIFRNGNIIKMPLYLAKECGGITCLRLCGNATPSPRRRRGRTAPVPGRPRK